MFKQFISLLIFCTLMHSVFAQATKKTGVFVNQAGYNLNEAKRFVSPNVADGTSFSIYNAGKT
ncbi:MAG: hypothetical protein HC867_06135 [Bacteroidia bacterium]|nr:hypothetical protein [Bacteroidia bacterium]